VKKMSEAKESEMVKPVWEERWDEDGGDIDLLGEEDGAVIVVGRIGRFFPTGLSSNSSGGRSNLAAAAPAMARALCISEWVTSHELTTREGEVLECSWCAQEEHTAYCALDQALTAAGLDAEAREAAREAEARRDDARMLSTQRVSPEELLSPEKLEERKEQIRASRAGTEEEKNGWFAVDPTRGSNETGDGTRQNPFRTWTFLVQIESLMNSPAIGWAFPPKGGLS
jgi:hypothetical protein